MNHHDVQAALRSHVNPDKAAFFPKFFKTGPGQYGEGDKFLGITVIARSVLVILVILMKPPVASGNGWSLRLATG